MGYLLNRLKFAEEQFNMTLKKSKKSKRKPIRNIYSTGVELTIKLGGYAHRDVSASFSSNGFKKDIITFFPFVSFFVIFLLLITLVIMPLTLVAPVIIVSVYYAITIVSLMLLGYWFSNEKRSKFDNFISKFIFKFYPFSLYRTMKMFRLSAIHEFVHFYDKRIDSLNYHSNFKNIRLGSKDKNYYNEVTEINAHFVSKLYKMKNKKFKSFGLFYKSVSKIRIFKYLTEPNKKLIYKYLDEYYHETRKENQS